MSNPNKVWSWGALMGRGVGSALGGGMGGAVTGALNGAGPILVGSIAFVAGFAGGALGYALGHQWDDPPRIPETWGSAGLYNTVVTGASFVLLCGLFADKLPTSPEAFVQ